MMRLGRIEGQVRGLQRLVAEDTYCIDILTQVSAVTPGELDTPMGYSVRIVGRPEERPLRRIDLRSHTRKKP